MEDITFQNMDSWRGGNRNEGLTIKQIILQHINQVVKNGSVEWHGGYWEHKQLQAWTEKHYVQNSREVYNNSVIMLRAILLPYFDEEMTKADKELIEKIETNEKKLDEDENTSSIAKRRQQRIKHHTRLFEELILLAKRLNFFEEQSADIEL